MQILTQHQIEQKIKRLAIQILEQNYKEKEIILAGINNNGMVFAKLLVDQLQQLTEITISLTQIRINPANPLADEITIGIEPGKLKNKVVIVVDDVANSGRTLFFATKPLFSTICKKIEMAVLVERHHKSYPVMVEYVGISLNTTLKEDINVQIAEGNDWGVFLD